MVRILLTIIFLFSSHLAWQQVKGNSPKTQVVPNPPATKYNGNTSKQLDNNPDATYNYNTQIFSERLGDLAFKTTLNYLSKKLRKKYSSHKRSESIFEKVERRNKLIEERRKYIWAVKWHLNPILKPGMGLGLVSTKNFQNLLPSPLFVLGATGLGVMVEKRIHTKLNVEVGVDLNANFFLGGEPGIAISDEDNIVGSKILVNIRAGAKLKYCYNESRRIRKGKHINYFTNNYFSLGTIFLSPSFVQEGSLQMDNKDFHLIVGLYYGMRRVIAKEKLLFFTEVGVEVINRLSTRARPSSYNRDDLGQRSSLSASIELGLIYILGSNQQ